MGTVRLVVELEIEVHKARDDDMQDALEVVDRLLDSGELQDAVNEHDFEWAGPMTVKNVSVRGLVSP